MLKFKEVEMEDYLIWLNGGNCISGTAEENELIKLKENYKKAESGKHVDDYVCYELKDTDGIVCINLFNVQAIAITKCTENEDIGFNIDSQISLDDVKKCARECSKQLKDSLQKMQR
jgi:hypothetical protein